MTCTCMCILHVHHSPIYGHSPLVNSWSPAPTSRPSKHPHLMQLTPATQYPIPHITHTHITTPNTHTHTVTIPDPHTSQHPHPHIPSQYSQPYITHTCISQYHTHTIPTSSQLPSLTIPHHHNTHNLATLTPSPSQTFNDFTYMLHTFWFNFR